MKRSFLVSFKPIEYSAITQAFALAVAESVAVTREACRHDDKSSAKDPSALTDSLKQNYQRHVKALFKAQDDPAIERELGVIYGSLMTHLQATHALWRSYATSNNKLVNIAEESEECCRSASNQGRRHNEMLADVIAQFLRREASLRGKAEMLARLLYQHVQQRKIDYYSYPHSSYCRERGGCHVNSLYVGTMDRRSLELHFGWWDGADQCYAPLGALFISPEQRKYLQETADHVFGAPVEFSADFNTIKLDELVINA